jgi:hypothetical protein
MIAAAIASLMLVLGSHSSDVPKKYSPVEVRTAVVAAFSVTPDVNTVGPAPLDYFYLVPAEALPSHKADIVVVRLPSLKAERSHWSTLWQAYKRRYAVAARLGNVDIVVTARKPLSQSERQRRLEPLAVAFIRRLGAVK